MSADFDTDFTDEPVCPWCGEAQGDAWELFKDASGDVEAECADCGKPIMMTQDVTVTYSTWKPKAGEEGA